MRAFVKLSPLLSSRLAKIGQITPYAKNETIYSQGGQDHVIFYILEGMVMLTVQTKNKRPAVISLLGAGQFFNELCLLRSSTYRSTATTIGECTIIAIHKDKMVHLLDQDKEFAHFFQSCLLTTILTFREDRVDMLINPCEKRLARVLLGLVGKAADGSRVSRIPRISQHVLAEMIGTTRSRTNFFMEGFRKRGFISYTGGLQIKQSLLRVLKDK